MEPEFDLEETHSFSACKTSSITLAVKHMQSAAAQVLSCGGQDGVDLNKACRLWTAPPKHSRRAWGLLARTAA